MRLLKFVFRQEFVIEQFLTLWRWNIWEYLHKLCLRISMWWVRNTLIWI